MSEIKKAKKKSEKLGQKRLRKKIETRQKPRLIKEGEEVATSALDRITKLQEQIEEAKTAALEELREKRKEAAATLADVDRQIAALTGSPTSKGTRKPREDKGPRKCKICGQEGHNARGHEKAMAAQGK